MKGFVPTPQETVDLMVEKLFGDTPPSAASIVLDPGSGTGAFVDGIGRWCTRNSSPRPQTIAIEQDKKHIPELKKAAKRTGNVEVRHADFLSLTPDPVDYVIANPPYVPITKLDEDEKARYRARFEVAKGRFDLYQLFYEQALRFLRPDGRLVFITPEKFLYVETAATLRKLLTNKTVLELDFLDEQTFGDLVTYPLVTTVENSKPRNRKTLVKGREGKARRVKLPRGGESWLPALNGIHQHHTGATLEDVCDRISCGVATGADGVFVQATTELGALACFAYPTIAGRELVQDQDPQGHHSILVPYSKANGLMPEKKLGALGKYLRRSNIKERLLRRTCVARKPWYAFHETPPLDAILRPKVLCKDIAATPFFVADPAGEIVPRHTVYYLVPKNPNIIPELLDYLNSDEVAVWLRSHCQRAANGYLRLQSKVLKKIPIPKEFTEAD